MALISYVVISISLLIIAFNIWSSIRKYRRRNCKFHRFIVEKDFIINLLGMLAGLYFILMVLGQFLLLKLVTLIIGALFVIGGIIELYVDSVKLKKGGSLLFFLIKNTFSLVMLILGTLLILISIASLRQ